MSIEALPGTSSRVRRRNFGNNHAYYLQTPGGEAKLDGVTSLLSDGLPKPALVGWAAKTVAQKAVDNWDELGELTTTKRYERLKSAHWEDRDTAAQKGTLIHALAEKLIAGMEVDVPEEIAGHVESAVKFLDDYRIRPILTETTVWNEKSFYGGTLDMVVTSDLPEHAGKVILADWKSSRSGIYDEAALQLSAYEHAENYIGPDGLDHPMTELGITDAWGVWIRPDGYDVYPLDTGDSTFEFFRFIATVARRARALKEAPLKGDALHRPTSPTASA